MGIPDANGLIVTSGGDTVAIRGPCYCLHKGRMIPIGYKSVAIVSIPDASGIITTSGGDAVSIRGPCYCRHKISVS